MPIPPVTEFEGQLPVENEPATFPARAEALFAWLVGQGMPEFNAAVAALNATLNDNGTVLETAGKAIALTTNANTAVPTGGTGNAYTITPAVPVAAYENGQVFMITVNRANTGAVTLAVGARPAVPVRKLNADGATFGELVANDWRIGEIHVVGFRDNQFVLLTPPLNRFLRSDAAATVSAAWTFNGELAFGNAAQVLAALAAVPVTRSISTGSGLTGGGNLSANRSLAVDSTVVRTTRTVGTTNGLVGGGSLDENRTLGLAASERMTTANVLAQIADLSAGAVGSFALLERSATTTASDVDWNGTYPGSALNPTGFAAQASGPGIASAFKSSQVMSGTWRALGSAEHDEPGHSGATLFVRIA